MQGDEFSVASANDVAIADRRPFDRPFHVPLAPRELPNRATPNRSLSATAPDA